MIQSTVDPCPDPDPGTQKWPTKNYVLSFRCSGRYSALNARSGSNEYGSETLKP
jgi:hypothetical protein